MPRRPLPHAGPQGLERAALAARVPALALRNELPAAAFPKEGRGKLDVYFTRVFNPVWTNPDGFSWIEVLARRGKIGLHVALTPTWSETAWFADYVLPMGHGPERHDTDAARRRTPAAGSPSASRCCAWRCERRASRVEYTHEANPGEVWEEDEFWIELSWRIDPDGNLGIRKHFESPVPPGRENHGRRATTAGCSRTPCPACPRPPPKEGLDAARRTCASTAPSTRRGRRATNQHESKPVAPEAARRRDASTAESRAGDTAAERPAETVGVDDRRRRRSKASRRRRASSSSTRRRSPIGAGPNTPCRPTSRATCIADNLDRAARRVALLPTFRLPTLIHTRSRQRQVAQRDLAHQSALAAPDGRRAPRRRRPATCSGRDRDRPLRRSAWVTEGIRPGVVACSHHMGRWRLTRGRRRRALVDALVDLQEAGAGKWRIRQHPRRRAVDERRSRLERGSGGATPACTRTSPSPCTPTRSAACTAGTKGAPCERAEPDDHYGDIFVDTAKSHEVYREWLKLTRPAPGPDGLRRPLWLRPLRLQARRVRLPPRPGLMPTPRAPGAGRARRASRRPPC